mmetsp:Transcript_11541/g.37877  ORF Transcript_11541/g.37877 Transcript_11541/m.37877 type:complete len:199 (+) Transcript_11541:3-599(+)
MLPAVRGPSLAARPRVVALRSSTTCCAKRTLEDLAVDNTFVRELPGDESQSPGTRQVFSALYSRCEPTPAAEPGAAEVLAFSDSAAALLDLDPAEKERQYVADCLAGSEPLVGAEAFAQCYGGHQFGQWAGQLGDGRALSLLEVVNEEGQRWELQLKGRRPTHAGWMGGRFCDRLCGSLWRARRCTPSAFQRRAHCRS